MTQHSRAKEHAEIALAIKAAKKKMFANSRAGMDLREAASQFATDVINRFDVLIPRGFENPPSNERAEPQPEEPQHLSRQAIQELARGIVGFEEPRLADALLILAYEFELASQRSRGPLEVEGMVIDIEEAILPQTTQGQELRHNLIRDLHAKATSGAFGNPRKGVTHA